MAKSKTYLSKFLDIECARSINNQVYNSTGCFLFLTLPEEELLAPAPSSNGGDSYRYNVLNLYKMYCDYGHYFFWFCLQENNLPPQCPEQDISLKNDQKRVLNHYRFINRARHVLAHGIFQLPTMNKAYTDPKIELLKEFFKEHLHSNMWPTSEQDWKTINTYIVNESNFLFDWLSKWANNWSVSSDDEAKNTLKMRFYYGCWSYSKDKNNCYFNTASGDGSKENYESYLFNEYENQKFCVYEEKEKNLTSFAKVFTYQFVLDAKSYLISVAPNTARSEYQEGDIYWEKKSPDINLKFLFKNINFYGIDNIRETLLNPNNSKKPCPDCYRLYLIGLTQKIASLPETGIAPSETKHFRR